MRRGMETHNHDEHHVYDGVETQERSEMEDYDNSDKLMASLSSRKNILASLEGFKVQSVKFSLHPALWGLKLYKLLRGYSDSDDHLGES